MKKLYPSLREVILRQFLTGDTIQYLAALYGFPTERIENLIRETLQNSRAENHALRNDLQSLQMERALVKERDAQAKPDGAESLGS